MRASRRGMILRFRRAHEAHRDARLVFRAAAAGRPLELQKRLVLGKLAGGLDRTSCITADRVKYTIASGHVLESSLREAGLFPGPLECTPLGASMLGGHDDCTKVLTQSWKQDDAIDASKRTIGKIYSAGHLAPWLASCMWHSSHSEGVACGGTRSGARSAASVVDVLRWRR